jgi:predicted ATPase
MAARYGHDLRTNCHCALGHVLSCQGSIDKALGHAKDAIAAARAAAHPAGEVVALSVAAVMHRLRGEVALCLEQAEAGVALASEQIIPFLAMYAMAPSGWALVKKGRTEEGLGRLREALDAYRATGARFRLPEWLAPLAELCLETGRIEEGLSAVGEALAVTEETKIRWYEAELHRLEGELLLVSKKPEETRAEASFRNAVEIARAQQAKSWELRAATSLARLLARQERREEARGLLAPIYGWFTEGFDTADLIAAKALLEQLAP